MPYSHNKYWILYEENGFLQPITASYYLFLFKAKTLSLITYNFDLLSSSTYPSFMRASLINIDCSTVVNRKPKQNSIDIEKI